MFRKKLINPQALVISHEIIRIAILWHEQWHEGLEEASRLYFNEKNPEGMIAVLEPLHAKLEEVFNGCVMQLCTTFSLVYMFQGPQTARETSFAQVFGRELAEAREVCRRYRIHGETSELDKAWDIYYGVSFPKNIGRNFFPNHRLHRSLRKLRSSFRSS